ncbi:MAG: DEAD/DEAH box helicase [Rhodospirillales bacterium]
MGDAALDRGTRYQRRRQALVTDTNPAGTHIKGRVQGTQRRPYTVNIRLRPHDNGRVEIDGSCTCPMAFNCKHVAALLIESMATPAAEAPAPLIKAPVLPLQRAQPPQGVAPPQVQEVLPPHVQNWLAAFDRAMALDEDDYPPSIRQRLLYVLSVANAADDPPRAIVELKSVRLLKDGSFSKTVGNYDSQQAFTSTPAKFLRGADLPILRRLLQMRGLYGYSASHGSALSGETAAEILELVVATGRCRWQTLDGPIVARGAARHGSIGWVMLESGAQKPVVSVEGGGTAVCSLPPWYVDGETATCGPLLLDVSPRMAEVLMQAPAVELQEVAALRGKLAERLAERKELLPPEPPATEVIAEPPTPVLQLLRQPLKYSFSWLPPSGPQDLQLARLAFAYGPASVPADDGRDQPLLAKNGRLLSIRRNRKLERQYRKRLTEAGLTDVAYEYRYSLPTAARSHLMLASDDALAWPRFLVEVAPHLRGEGWRIEIAPDFAPPLAEADGDVDAILQEGSGIDWFDLHLGVAVDGQRVNILPQLIKLLKAVPDDADAEFFDLEDDDPKTTFVTLDDGRLLPLPYARLKPILAALHALFRLDFVADGEKLGFRRSNAADLAALEEMIAGAGIAWTGGEALRALGRRLREFGSISRLDAPEGFAATLRPYQGQGYGWLRFLGETGLGGVLADDMGLGKTVQTLAHLLAEKRDGRGDRPSLVVAPTSLMANWRLEAERFAPGLKVLTLHGPERKTRFPQVPEHDLVLTTYALLARDQDALLAQPWHAVVADEAQNIKNPATHAARILRRLDARQRFCLTGTPVENHLGELWALMDFLNPGLLGDRKSFARTYRVPIEKNSDAGRRQALARRVRPFLLRRTKAEVATELPPKTEMIEHVEMEVGQSALYEGVRLAMHRKVRETIAAKGLGRSRIIILEALLKLRQVCCDPRLLKLPPAGKAGAGSAKLARLMEMLDELVDEGRRVLVFSQFTSMLALIEERLAAAEIAFVKITGDVTDRLTPVQRFQVGEVPVFLVSLKAGGTGLNLTAADTVILYDPWWNPAVEAQAIDRSHRIGQDKPVFVHRLVTLNSIEEKMLELQQRKGALAAGLFDPEVGGALDITESDVEMLLAAG